MFQIALKCLKNVMEFYKMKKNALIIVMFSVLSMPFSQTKNDIGKFVFDTEISNVYGKDASALYSFIDADKVDESNWYCLYGRNDLPMETEIYLTDLKRTGQYHALKSNVDWNVKYLTCLGTTAIFADFDYDYDCEILHFASTEMYAYMINEFYEYPDYTNDLIQPQHSSDSGAHNYNSEAISNHFYTDIIFCVVNNHRGIKIKTYLPVSEHDKNNYCETWNFYKWTPFKHSYILDKSVTQEQMKNAIVPKDYFAYNGLKFSKLDSRLTDKDLQSLDKAQLRLMRNAVYARHGRMFKSMDLQSLWECYAWYRPNPDYSDDLLTETDRANIELIREFERR